MTSLIADPPEEAWARSEVKEVLSEEETEEETMGCRAEVLATGAAREAAAEETGATGVAREATLVVTRQAVERRTLNPWIRSLITT